MELVATAKKKMGIDDLLRVFRCQLQCCAPLLVGGCNERMDVLSKAEAATLLGGEHPCVIVIATLLCDLGNGRGSRREDGRRQVISEEQLESGKSF